MGYRVKDLTGQGLTTSVGMEAADLGIMRWDHSRNAVAAMFGDNFTLEGLKGEWQSPSIVMYDENHDTLGVPTASGIEVRPRRQLWPYTHNNPEFTTVLPCDFIRVGDWWHVAAMVTKGLGNELRTEFWRSRDLIMWEYEFALKHPGHPGNVNLTFERVGDWVYVMGTGGLKRDRGIWLWRNRAAEFPRGWWEPWGWNGSRWAWGIRNEASPVIAGRFGEINLRIVNNWLVLSYFNSAAARVTARRVANVTDNWYEAPFDHYMLRGPDDATHVSYLYGGYISPLSRLGSMKYAVSQWNISPSAGNKPYKAILCEGALSAP